MRPDIATLAVPTTVNGRNMDGDDFALTAGWGHYGTGEAVMPGQGRIVERDLHSGRTRCPWRCNRHTRSDHIRYLPERQRLLAQRPGCGLALQAGGLSGAQEVAVVSGTGGAGPGAEAGGGVVFCGGGAANWGDSGGRRYAGGVGLRLWLIRPTGLFSCEGVLLLWSISNDSGNTVCEGTP